MLANYTSHSPFVNNYGQAVLWNDNHEEKEEVIKAVYIGGDGSFSITPEVSIATYGSGKNKKQYYTRAIADYFRDWSFAVFEQQYQGQVKMMEESIAFCKDIGFELKPEAEQQTMDQYTNLFFSDNFAFLVADIYYFFNSNIEKQGEEQAERRRAFEKALKASDTPERKIAEATDQDNLSFLSDEAEDETKLHGQTGPLNLNIDIKYPDSENKDGTVLVNIEEIIKIAGYSFSPLIRGHHEYIPWQEAVIYDRSRFICVVGSRQGGKSHVMALRGLIKSFEGYRQDILVCAFQTEATGHIYKYMTRMMENFPEGTFVESKQKGWITNTLTGSRIIFRSLSKEADRIRGWTLHEVIMDECYLIADNIYEAVILPTLSTTGGSVCMISTPGPKNWFYWEVMRARQGAKHYSYYQFTIEDNPFIVPMEKERIMEKRDDPVIRREWFCEFDEGANQVFRPKKIDDLLFYLEHKHHAHFVFGYDPARKGKDRAGYTCLMVWGGKVLVIRSGFIPDSHKGDWDTQFQWMKDNIFNDGHNYKVVVDCTGVGDGVVKLMQAAKITVNMAVQYTSGLSETEDFDYPYGTARAMKAGKSRLINNAQNFMDEGFVKFYSYANEYLFYEMDAITEKRTQMGFSTFTTKGFDDITNSCMISLYYVEKESLLTKVIKEVEKKEATIADDVYFQPPKKYHPKFSRSQVSGRHW